MNYIIMNLVGYAQYVITGPWRCFCRWVRAEFIRATISGLEDDLSILNGMPGPNEEAKKLIRKELEDNKQALYLVTRKGGV